MNKAKITTISLLVLLVILGGYILWSFTSVGDKVLSITSLPPSEKVVKEFFPSENVQKIGTVKSTFKKGSGYMFLLERNGKKELIVLPKDFNRQDINKRSYILIESGEYIPEEEVDYMRINVRDEVEKSEKEQFRILYRHNISVYEDGEVIPEVVDYYKLEFYNDKNVWFYNDEDNNLKVNGKREVIKLLETF